VPTSSA